MRPALAFLTLTSVCSFPAVAPTAEVTRVLRLTLSPSAGSRFAVENLAGHMRVSTGSGGDVIAVATVHAESEELVQAVRLEQVTVEDGRPALRVRYPLEGRSTVRYPGTSRNGLAFFGWGDSSNVRYDGHRVRVSASRGALVYADVEVQLPRKALDAAFRNAVGPIQAEGVQGRVRLDSGNGPITVSRAQGELVADTGSGDVDASDISGDFRCDTGSGECHVERFNGGTLSCDTGSGDVKLHGVSARRILLDTGSGGVELTEGDAEEVAADTGSGDLRLKLPGRRLARLKADTGSGDVELVLAPDASFEARADIGSGEIVSRFDDAQPIVRDGQVVGYRRGDGRIRIDVDSGSGDLVVEPASGSSR